jgi:hypothetical protein
LYALFSALMAALRASSNATDTPLAKARLAMFAVRRLIVSSLEAASNAHAPSVDAIERMCDYL